MSSQKKQPAKVIELSGEDILALAGDAKGQEERNLSVEAIRDPGLSQLHSAGRFFQSLWRRHPSAHSQRSFHPGSMRKGVMPALGRFPARS